MVNLFIELTNDYPKNIKVEREWIIWNLWN
jgi:hypothetical protein